MLDSAEPPAVDPEILVERARSLAPLLRERAGQTETDRRVSPEVIQAVRDKDLFRLLQPRRYGGFEGEFTTLARVIFDLAGACASTGWVAGMLTVHQWLAAHFPLETQDEVWGADSGNVVAGAYYQAARARPARGGYRLSGQWRLISGIDHVHWCMLGVMFPPDDKGGRPQPGFLMLSDQEFSVEDDWYAVGLSGTGSKTVVVDHCLVPAHRRVTFAEINGCAAEGALAHGNPIYNIPLLTALTFTIATPAIGILQGAIEDFIELTAPRKTYGAVVTGGSKVADYQAVQSRLGEAQAAMNAAKVLVLHDLRETQREALAGNTFGLKRRLNNRLSQAFVVKLAREGVDGLYGATGGTGLYLDQRLQRAWRDVNAIAHHVSLNWDAVSSMWGQYALGLEPKGQY